MAHTEGHNGGFDQLGQAGEHHSAPVATVLEAAARFCTALSKISEARKDDVDITNVIHEAWLELNVTMSSNMPAGHELPQTDAEPIRVSQRMLEVCDLVRPLLLEADAMAFSRKHPDAEPFTPEARRACGELGGLCMSVGTRLDEGARFQGHDRQ